MTKPLEHHVFTNFGVGITDERWLSYRLAILQNTVYRSLQAQTCKDFTWHVFLDYRLPEIIKIQLEELKDVGTDIALHYTEKYRTIIKDIRAICQQSKSRVLITSRIDDDDCLHIDAIKRLQAIARDPGWKTDIAVASFCHGIEYLAADRIGRHSRYKTLALGLSLIDRNPKKSKRSIISEYAHHSILDTLAAAGTSHTYYGIEDDEPSFIYTKHPISDSYYFGARARIINDVMRIESSDMDFSRFGLTEDNAGSLARIACDAPLGQPYKYLEQLNAVRKSIEAHTLNEKADVAHAPPDESLMRLLFKEHRLESQATRRNPTRNSFGKIRVAILGSCVTRDLFEVQKDALSEFEICFYSARATLGSMLSCPCLDPRIVVSDDSFESKRAIFDLTKSTWEKLEISRPDIVIVDLIDERIGSIFHAGSVLTASGPMVKGFERAHVDFQIMRPWSDPVTQLRQWAAPHFLHRLGSICDSIFLHEASWADEYINEAGQKDLIENTEFGTLASLNNTIIFDTIKAFEQSLTPFESIGGLRSNTMLAGGNHRWTFSPFHYDASYYKALARQLLSKMPS